MSGARIALPALALVALLAATQAQAREHQVKMLNKGAAGFMVFEPAYVKAAPGDTVRFVPTDSGHSVETIAGMLPAGAQPFKSATGKELVVKVRQPGVYGYKCPPHYGMGMVGVIQVGKPTNLAAALAVAHPGKARHTMAGLLSQAGSAALAER
jgi:pseudoazurin